MDLIKATRQVLDSLQSGRGDEAEKIAEGLRAGRVVGVLGEAEVGKSETIRQALRPLEEAGASIALDLDDAADIETLGYLIARGIAEAFLAPEEFEVLSDGALIAGALETKRLELAEILGLPGLDEALRNWPSGTFELTTATKAIEALAKRRPTTLWVDHLEAPALTPRHPLDLDAFLWSLREMVQRLPRLSLVLSGRNPVEDSVLGREAAFFQQGRWLTLDNPPFGAWLPAAEALGLPRAAPYELYGMTGGHPETMLFALAVLATREGDLDPVGLIGELAVCSFGLTNRAQQHARSLHRLGDRVLTQVARGQGPYAAAQRGSSPPQEIRRVLGRLQLAGLIRHDDAWSVVNPLVRIVLAEGTFFATKAPDWSLDPEGREAAT